MRHAHMLGAREPFVWRLVPALVAQMGQAYPELIRAQALISETLKLEEARFRHTLDRGLKLLEEETGRLPRQGALPGEVAFKLYDTYGFPIDLTQDILRGQGRTVEREGFDVAMERQRAAARAAWAGSGEAATGQLWFELKEKHGATDFLGYATETAEGQVLAIVVDGKSVPAAEEGQEASVIVNQTPFYGEAGGQTGDTGWFQSASGGRLQVTDTQRRLGDLFVHAGRLVAGRLSVGDTVEMKVDGERRTRLRANHSATHLLHQALRKRLGEHVTQKGSLVAADRLRFDFSHPKPLAPEDIRWIEEEVNARIRRNAAVVTQLMTPDDAVAAGALALFGEKYGEEVRVVSMGHDEDEGPAWSTELCGGTHVRRTGDIGLFKIVAESAVAAGVRRIEALTGQAAFDYLAERDALLAEMAGTVKASPNELPQRVVSLMEERRRLERELMEARRRLAAGDGASSAEPDSKTVAGVAFAGKLVGDLPAKELKGLADQMKGKLGSGVVTLVGTSDGKVSIVVAVTEDLTGRISAVDLVRAAAEAVGGKGGGGRPGMAQAGGPDAAKAPAALAAVETALAEKLQVAAE
jgi:alanyl-tRNA synthetase